MKRNLALTLFGLMALMTSFASFAGISNRVEVSGTISDFDQTQVSVVDSKNHRWTFSRAFLKNHLEPRPGRKIVAVIPVRALKRDGIKFAGQ